MSLRGSCFDHAVVDQGHGEPRWKSWCFEECGEGGYELIVSHIMCTVGTVALMRIKFKPNRKIMCHTFFAP